MEEQLIGQKLAKLAIKKGCNLPIYGNGYEFNDRDGNVFWTNTEFGISGKEKTKPIIVMTQSLLQKWLREVHEIHIENHFGKDKSSIWYNPKLFSLIKPNDGDDYYEESYEELVELEQKDSYEEALEIALLAALNKIKHNEQKTKYVRCL